MQPILLSYQAPHELFAQNLCAKVLQAVQLDICPSAVPWYYSQSELWVFSIRFRKQWIRETNKFTSSVHWTLLFLLSTVSANWKYIFCLRIAEDWILTFQWKHRYLWRKKLRRKPKAISSQEIFRQILIGIILDLFEFSLWQFALCFHIRRFLNFIILKMLFIFYFCMTATQEENYLAKHSFYL